MKLLEQGKALVTDKEVQSGSIDFFADSVAALIGDPVAVGKMMVTLLQSPFLLNEKIFWNKFELFLNGIDTSDSERAMFCERLTSKGRKGENPYRLIAAINRCDTQRKITYLIAASRCLAADFIDLSTYFRIVHTIMDCLQEDLEFVSDNILNHGEYEYSDTVQGLMNCGLMYQCVMDCNGNDKYTFTPFADTIDIFALSYDNVDRYPDPISSFENRQQSRKTTDINNVVLFDLVE